MLPPGVPPTPPDACAGRVEPSLQLADGNQLAAPKADKPHVGLDMRAPGVPRHAQRLARLLDAEGEGGRAPLPGRKGDCRTWGYWGHRGYRPQPARTGQQIAQRTGAGATLGRASQRPSKGKAAPHATRPCPRRFARSVARPTATSATTAADLHSGSRPRTATRVARLTADRPKHVREEDWQLLWQNSNHACQSSL